MERASDIDLNEFSTLIRKAWADKFPQNDPPENGQILNLAKNTKFDAMLCLDTLFDMSDDGNTTFNLYMRYCRERSKSKDKSNADFAIDENTGMKHKIYVDGDGRQFYYVPKPKNEEDAILMRGFQLTPELAIDRDMSKEQRNDMIGRQIEYLLKSKQITQSMYEKMKTGLDILKGNIQIDLQSDIKVNPDLL